MSSESTRVQRIKKEGRYSTAALIRLGDKVLRLKYEFIRPTLSHMYKTTHGNMANERHCVGWASLYILVVPAIGGQADKNLKIPTDYLPK